MGESAKNVRVYDVDTGRVTEIPASELAPNMILMELPNVGPVFVTSAHSKLLSVSSPAIDSSEWENIAHIVFSNLPRLMPEEKFIGGMRTDGAPVGELKEWMLIAALWNGLKPPKPEDAERIAPYLLHVILAVRNNGKQAMQTVDLTKVGKDLAQFIIDRTMSFTEQDLDTYWRTRIDMDAFRRLEKVEQSRIA